MEQRKTVFEMRKKDFWKLPKRGWCEDIGPFVSMVILPTGQFHESGYRCMDFVAVDEEMYPICRLSGVSDVIEIDGIGGYGKERDITSHMVSVKGWKIDCLPCGYLRIFADSHITCGEALSSFEIFG